jgi:ABC-type glycerol-3-phosphate transport system permease component
MRKLSLREQIIYQLGLTLLGVFVLLPIWGLLYLAFDAGVQGWPLEFRLWPEEPSLAVFQAVWDQPAQGLTFLGALKNSLLVSLSASAFAVVMGASMAYAFARYRFWGRRIGLFALLVGALLPPVALMTPMFILLSAIHIRTTLLGLSVVYTAMAMPFCVWNMRSAFQSVPKEVEESAYLDGASDFTTFYRITLPLALPSIAVAAIMAFLVGYSEFALGWLFVDKSTNVTLGMMIWGLLSGASTSFSITRIAAAALLTTGPVVVLVLLLQRYLMSGLLTGTIED